MSNPFAEYDNKKKAKNQKKSGLGLSLGKMKRKPEQDLLEDTIDSRKDTGNSFKGMNMFGDLDGSMKIRGRL
jgi:hypothetical protein